MTIGLISAPPRYSGPAIRAMRTQAGVTQVRWAAILGISPTLASAWETERRTPDGPGMRLLQVVEKHGLDFVADMPVA